MNKKKMKTLEYVPDKDGECSHSCYHLTCCHCGKVLFKDVDEWSKVYLDINQWTKTDQRWWRKHQEFNQIIFIIIPAMIVFWVILPILLWLGGIL